MLNIFFVSFVPTLYLSLSLSPPWMYVYYLRVDGRGQGVECDKQKCHFNKCSSANSLESISSYIHIFSLRPNGNLWPCFITLFSFFFSSQLPIATNFIRRNESSNGNGCGKKPSPWTKFQSKMSAFCKDLNWCCHETPSKISSKCIKLEMTMIQIKKYFWNV